MVWGMAVPNKFGEFWPDGDFEKDLKTGDCGWFNRLRAYYKKQSPEEKKRLFDYGGDPRLAWHYYGTFPSDKFTHEPGTKDKSGLEPPFGRVEPHEVPRTFDTEKTYKTIGSLITVNSRIIAVSEPLKAIIQRMEPDVHEFFPFEIRMPKGMIHPGFYYILRICQYFDAFSRENSWEGSVRDIPGYQETPGLTRVNASKKALNGLAMSKSDFGDAHLWRDRAFGEDLTCFSDALMAEIEQAGLRLPKHYKMKEV